MKTLKILALFCVLIFVQCSETKKESTSLEYGDAVLKGRIVGKLPDGSSIKFFHLYEIPNLITGEMYDYRISVNNDGTFSKNIPLTHSALSRYHGSLFEGLIVLNPNKETILEINLLDNKKVETKLTSITKEDMESNKNIMETLFVNNAYNHLPENSSELEPKELWIGIFDETEKLLQETYSKYPLSDSLKNIHMFTTRLIFTNLSTMESEDPKFNSPDFSFLEKLNINDDYYLYSSNYNILINIMLESDMFPSISDKPLLEWQAEVNPIIKLLTGLESGLFYDLFTTNAYAKQIRDMNFLTEAQKKDIKEILNDSNYTKELFAFNAKIEERGKLNERLQSNDIIQFPDEGENISMEEIVKGYKGKVVFVDLWATWCGPCLNAMEEMHSVKKELEGKNIVYVYISNPSSPKEKWEAQRLKIGGEHYYISTEMWKDLCEIHNIVGVPTYFIYNEEGKLQEQLQFSDAETMKDILMKYL